MTSHDSREVDDRGLLDMQYPQQRLAERRCVLTVRRDAQQHDQQQPELVLEQHQHHKIKKLM